MTSLVWDGCLNVRDLGGLPTVDGAMTQAGRVVRSDNLRRLSERGRQALADHGVTRVVDLRFPEELAEDVAGDLPAEVVHVSLFGESRTAEWEAEQNASIDRAASADDYLREWYSDSFERYRDRFALAAHAIADAPEGAVVIHCLGGKDRTGLVAALLLRLVGVAIGEVARDYARTEEALAPRAAAWVEAAPDPVERRRRELLGPTPASVMVDVLRDLDARYGSVEEYLRGAGVGDDSLERLRERLVAP